MSEPNNVDPRETEKFGHLSRYWWDPNGPMRSLHEVNPLRTRFIMENVTLKGRMVLDIGCGGGLLSEALAKLGARVTGIDLSDALIEVAREHASQHNLVVGYHRISVGQLAAEMPAAFDAITCMEVLEHIPDPQAVIEACSRLLKPGGDAFFSTINRSLKSFLFAIVGAEYVLRLLPVGSHAYGRLIRPEELKAWANRDGFAFVKSASVAYNPLTRQFSLVARQDINYMLYFRRRSLD